MVKAFQSGHNKNAKFTVVGGAEIVLDVTDQQFSRSTVLHVIQCASLGRFTGRIPGFGDAKGTLTCEFDGLVPPYGANPGIQDGAAGLYKGYVNDNAGVPTWFAWYVRIETVHYAIPGGGKVSYSFDWLMDALTGTAVDPTA